MARRRGCLLAQLQCLVAGCTSFEVLWVFIALRFVYWMYVHKNGSSVRGLVMCSEDDAFQKEEHSTLRRHTVRSRVQGRLYRVTVCSAGWSNVWGSRDVRARWMYNVRWDKKLLLQWHDCRHYVKGNVPLRALVSGRETSKRLNPSVLTDTHENIISNVGSLSG